MTFLYPAFLWALTALSIPVIIHLFNFRKTTRIYFSNTRFLKQIKEATTAKRRLKHYLILASRLLFLFFLIITFCQPVIPAEEQLSSNPDVVLYLDNSQSMSAQMDDKTRGLDAAISFAQSIADVFPPDARYKLITNDFSPFSNTFKTKPEVLDLLTQIRLSPVSRTLDEVMDKIQQDKGLKRQEIFWISDLQKSTLGSINSNVDGSSKLHLVPIQYGQQSNVFVDSAYLDNPFSTGGGKNVLHVKIRNDGKREVNQLNLKLSLNDIQAGTSAVDIPQGGVSEAEFDLASSLSGLNTAKISFNDFPVSFDNEFYVAVNFTSKIRVIEIKNTNDRTVVEKVFGNETIFSFRSFPVSNFNYSLLSQADLVVANGLNSMETSLISVLRSYINNYGTVLMIPGTKPQAENLKIFLQLPSLKVVDMKAQLELGRPDFSNPFFENVFEEKSVSLAMPKGTKILDWGNDRTAILHFRNDQPFLSRFNQGGQLYVLACALDVSQTDFFNHALFVPVMYRIAASGKRDEMKPYYTLRESFIKLHVDSLRGEEPLRWVGDEEVVPAQRKINDDVIFDIPKFSMTKGFYKVVMQGDTVNLLAFNLDKAESLMDQYNGEDLQKILGSGDNVTIFQVGAADSFSKEIKERYLGKPLWKFALAMAIFFLLIEILLIRFLK
ncbi:MAG TPA: VWA domain-containing protein [Chryseolinea sp.]|nr:VWA domain-containing protein [Chryseolinea sp.]